MASVKGGTSAVFDGRSTCSLEIIVTEDSVNANENYSRCYVWIGVVYNSNIGFSGSTRDTAGVATANVDNTDIFSGNVPLPSGATDGTALLYQDGYVNVYHEDDGSRTVGFNIRMDRGSGNYSGDPYVWDSSGRYYGALTLTKITRDWTVSYNGNGGSTPSSQNRHAGTNITLGSSSRTGYTFSYWSGSDGKTYAAGATFSGNYALALTAIWKANTYTISYNANGGSGAPGNQTKTYDSSLTLTTAEPSRTGYTFAHWNTNANNTGTTYASGATFSANITSSITLYAIWSINSYYLDLNGWLNGASSGGISGYGTADVTVGGVLKGNDVTDYYAQHTYGTSYSISDIKATTGHTYQGVHSGSLSGTIGAGTTSVSLSFTTNTYTISYDANGGTGAPSAQTKVYDSALNFSSTEPTKTLAIFASWNTLSNGSGTSYAPGASIPNISSDLTVYAIWTPQYEITYLSNTSDTVTNLPAKQIKTYNQNISLSSSVPVRNLYNFISWNTSSSNTGTDYSPGTTYSTNAALTLYAIWKLAYILPSFTNVPTAIHSDSTGKAADEGTYINATVKWSVDRTIDTTNSGYSIQIDWKSTESSTYPTANTITKTISGVSGTTDIIFGAGAISSEITYDIKISLLDSYSQSKLSSAQKTITYIQIQNSSYAFDIYKEQDTNNFHACIGGPARDANVIDIKYGGSSMTAVSKTGAMTVKTSVTAPTFNGALNGNATTAATATTASSCTGNSATATTASSCSGNSATATKTITSVSGSGVAELVRCNMADNDQFRILAGGTGSNAGYAEISTADDGNEPIYVRQYTGGFSNLVRTATLLDGSGNTSFPGTLYVAGKSLLDRTYPVNSIYLSLGSTSPASLFGGTWTNLTDTWRMPLIGPDSWGCNNTGGSLSHAHNSGSLVAGIQAFAYNGNMYIDSAVNTGISYTQTSRTNMNSGHGAVEDNGFREYNQTSAVSVFGNTGTTMVDWQPYITIHGWRRVS